MSEENVELAYRSYDAVNRRDLDGLLALMDDDVEAVSRIVAMEGGLHGHDGIRRWWESWFSAFPDYKIEVDEVRDRGDFVFAAFMLTATVRAASSRSRTRSGTRVGGGTGNASGGVSAPAGPKPSKPPGCGSRPSGHSRGRCSRPEYRPVVMHRQYLGLDPLPVPAQPLLNSSVRHQLRD